MYYGNRETTTLGVNMTPEQIAEAIARLDASDLAKLGDELVIKQLAERIAFLCQVSLQEQDSKPIILQEQDQNV